MMISKIRKKINTGRRAFREDGITGLGIKTFEFLQKVQRKKGNNKFKHNVDTSARYEEILNADLSTPPEQSVVQKSSPWHFAWIMPPPGKGSGGHMNIFRFIKFLENAGHTCSIYLFTPGSHGTIEEVVSSMGGSYPNINAARDMQWLDERQQLPDVVDGIFATSWQTAYTSYGLSSHAKRFYFVQDFEPYFYPIGGMYTLAENTYKLGFTGITAGKWLSKKLAAEYGMKTDSFDFGAEASTYRYENKSKRTEIFYYARPYTARRGFEVGILALDIFHKQHPEYTINIVGYDVSEYRIPFPYKNLSILEIDQLSTLYNNCAAGLVLSYTNMSLLPLELLACGTIPVVNDAENNRLVSDNPFIAYSDNTPHALAKKLSLAVTNPDQQNYAEQAAMSVTDTGWEQSGEKFISIIKKEMHEK